MSDRLLKSPGDPRKLLAYKKADIIYRLTFRFCERFLRKGDRTVDQMVQAARSGKQNIIEGVEAAVTSKETELKLVNVARASLGELLEDYRDYRICHESAFEIPIVASEIWKLRLGVMNDYNSRPAENKDYLDTTYFTRLVFSWQ